MDSLKALYDEIDRVLRNYDAGAMDEDIAKHRIISLLMKCPPSDVITYVTARAVTDDP